MSLVATFDLEIEQLDVKTSFIHGDIEEEVYMKWLEGFTIKGKNELVYKLKKSLYGLKKSPRMWYQNFNMYIQELGFMSSWANHCVYNQKVSDYFIYVVLYVNDMLLVENNMDLIKEVKLQLFSKFDMKNLGTTHFILRMDIKRDRADTRLQLNQSKYVETIPNHFNMQGCKLVKVSIRMGVRLVVEQCPKTHEEIECMAHVPYASFVGSLMYAMVYT